MKHTNETAIAAIKRGDISGDFSSVTHLDVRDCPGLTALPDLPAVTHLQVRDCPGLTALPDLPAVTEVVWDQMP